MIPDGALDEGAGKVVECTLEGISKHRLALRSDANGVIHLVGVQLLLLFTEDLPQGGPPTECRDVTDYMLPESANPEAIQDGGGAANAVVCGYTPPARGQVPSRDLVVWGRVERPLAPPDLPPDVPCWQLILYLGAPRDTNLDLLNVTCRLQLP